MQHIPCMGDTIFEICNLTWENITLDSLYEEREYCLNKIRYAYVKNTEELGPLQHTSQELWPWNCESPKESVQKSSQPTSKIM